MPPPCPQCATPVTTWIPSCHSYPRGERQWMSCWPGCGSAASFMCDNDDCKWSYDWGLNPNNPRAARNESNRPPWLTGGYEEDNPQIPEGIRSIYDEDWE